jgi:cytosine/adenosine deaminase-related metal-dependent hydrolase
LCKEGQVQFDLLLSGGQVIDPANGLNGQFDVAIAGGRIAAVRRVLGHENARRVLDVRGNCVLPGLVDTHVHISPPFGGQHGYRMLAKAGVTCAIDMAGRPDSLFAGLKETRIGLAIGFVYPLIPGETTTNQDPGSAELASILDRALGRGALGVKILGGHAPLSPDATARTIQMAHQKHCWCAVHAGTTAKGSNIEGLEDLVTLADGLPLHIAHVNSYCRGQITGDPLLEASRALKALAQTPHIRSESYLAIINGTDATIENGVPRNSVAKTCLELGGYPPTAAGMEEAIAAGWAHIHGVVDGETRLLPPAEGLTHYRDLDTRAGVSFPVNPPSSAIALATARSDDGTFTVTALSSDGGAFPRNTTLKQGLALVRFGALSLEDLVVKACLNPARMLGLDTKGHLRVGADADVIVVEEASARVEWVIAHGQVLVQDGKAIGRGRARAITTQVGQRRLDDLGVQNRVIAPGWL